MRTETSVTVKVLRCSFMTVLLAAAAFPAQVDIYSAKDLDGVAKELTPKDAGFADKSLARYSNHYFLLAKREKTGSAELHEHEADVFVVQSGAATIVMGGKVVKGHAVKPGEIRGTSIEGGERHALAKGDVIHIPAGTAHQLLLTKGEPFVYFVVKVTGQ
jgi:mannose-6-phosphate isomerase-like protein (cupin superfamily)